MSPETEHVLAITEAEVLSHDAHEPPVHVDFDAPPVIKPPR